MTLLLDNLHGVANLLFQNFRHEGMNELSIFEDLIPFSLEFCGFAYCDELINHGIALN